MKNFIFILVATMLLANSWAKAGNDNPNDLTYCLALPSAQQIAKCAGELSAGGKRQTLSKDAVDKIISDENAKTPARASEPSGAQAAQRDGNK